MGTLTYGPCGPCGGSYVLPHVSAQVVFIRITPRSLRSTRNKLPVTWENTMRRLRTRSQIGGWIGRPETAST